MSRELSRTALFITKPAAVVMVASSYPVCSLLAMNESHSNGVAKSRITKIKSPFSDSFIILMTLHDSWLPGSSDGKHLADGHRPEKRSVRLTNVARNGLPRANPA